MFELPEIENYNRVYDRIFYLAHKLVKIRESWITDDWLLQYHLNLWSKE